MEFNINQNLNMELFMKYEKPLKEALSSDPARYWHSISVAITAVNLSSIYDENADDCLVSGLLHDFCKCIPKEQMFIECEKHGVILSEEDKNAVGCIHGFLGAKVCKDLFDISDRIYDAIYFHTCGKPDMNMLEKIIYIADFIEPLRKFRDKVSDIRKLAYVDINKSIVLAAEMNLEFLRNRNLFIHTNTIMTLDYYNKLIK